MLSKDLVKKFKTYCVEPNEDMRREAEKFLSKIVIFS